jgi:aryl-alcohol dehydrogenase-like predicted oxidoreductase
LEAIVAKANENQNRPKLKAMYQLGIIFAYYQPDMAGILIGPSSMEQLKANIDFYQTLPEAEYEDIYGELKRIQ